MKREKNILIPNSCFEADCSICKFAYRDGGELYCGMYRKTIMVGEMNDKKCPQFKFRLRDKIKIGIGLYCLITLVVTIIEIFIK